MYINFPEHFAHIIGFSGFQLKGKNRVSDKSRLYGRGIIFKVFAVSGNLALQSNLQTAKVFLYGKA